MTNHEEPERESTCEHPYVSRAWIGYSGYFHCHECGKIIEEEDTRNDRLA